MDDFSLILPIRLKGKIGCNRMHHPSLHLNGDMSHVVPQTGFGERVDATGRQGQIDRPACGDGHASYIRTTFVDINAKTAPDQAKGKQWSVEPCANQRDVPGVVSHAEKRMNRL